MNRIEPLMAAQFYKSYSIRAPLATHYRPGTCDEAECTAYNSGWRTLVDEGTDLGQRQANYIRRESGRKFTEEKTPAGLTDFVFEAGQKCFAPHQVPVGRPEIYIERGGDFRGNPRGDYRRHVRPADWVESFAEHQDKIAAASRRG